ncbi:putative sucrose-phosphate synthase 1 [Platanthera guangdongensis]|uniref:Sucrose-phosphate synthase 1 n=1 Tax=Platanthera guangdongensis TaxID=2320717 RepID=A0ABR2LUY1_9ASPA
MAGNEWIDEYLTAILDSGAAMTDNQKFIGLRERGLFNATRYFVEEVVTGVSEADLHRTWIRVNATRSSLERSTRVENMCWRIWHLARKKKQSKVSLLGRVLRSQESRTRRAGTRCSSDAPRRETG